MSAKKKSGSKGRKPAAAGASRPGQRPARRTGAPERPVVFAARAVLAGLLGWLFLGGVSMTLPGTPWTAFLLAGLVVALMFESLYAGILAAAVGLVGVVMLDVRAPAEVTDVQLVVLPALAAAAGVAGTYLRRYIDVRIIGWIVVALLIGAFFSQAGKVAPQVAQKYAAEPANESYAFDPVFFMKVYHMVDRGVPFYQAYGEGFAGDGRFDKPQQDIAGWRTPVTFWVWKLVFRDGADFVWGYVLFSALALGLAYHVAAKVSDAASALVAPALLFPYYLVALPTLWFTELEFWAGYVALVSAAFWVSKLRWPALGFATLAGSMREWLLSSLVAGSVQMLKERRWRALIAWAAATASVVGVYLVNMRLVSDYLRGAGVTPSLGAAGRAGNGGADFVLYTLQFCSERFLHPYAVPYAAFFLALVVAGYLVYRGEYYLPALFVLPLLAFLYFGSGQKPGGEAGWNDYYNASFMPFACILAGAAPRLLGLLERHAAGDSSVERRAA